MESLRQKVGKRGEDEACARLRDLGHLILARNWRSGHLEIDIVSLTPGGLHFVEVKSLTAPALTNPEDKVDRTKQEKLARAARAFLRSDYRKALPGDYEIFFDVVTVVFYNDGAETEYFPQAFLPIYV